MENYGIPSFFHFPPGVAYHSTSLGNDCVKYIWANSNQVPESDFNRLFGDMNVRHSLPPLISIGLFQKKSKETPPPPPRSLRVGVDDIYIFLKKLLEFIDLSLYPCLKKTSFHDWLFHKLVLHPKNQRPIENSHDFFLITPRKSTSFLIDSGISACFFQYFLNFMSSTAPV